MKKFTLIETREELNNILTREPLILDADNNLWGSTYDGEWQCLMDMAWPKEPTFPVYLITE